MHYTLEEFKMKASLLFLHIFFAMLWIGGMVFNLLFLHPVLKNLKNEELKRETARKVLRRFFLGVWLSIGVLFLSGMWMWHSFRPDLSQNPLFHIKLFLFAIMVVNFSYIYFYLLRKELFKHIPNFVWINLLLGTLITMIISYIRFG
jgi:uncharacterized membrane protein